jgi:hypothetical protein
MATPPPSSTHHVTALLKAWGRGDASALDALLAAVYPELHRQAERYMRGQLPSHTLQATALVRPRPGPKRMPSPSPKHADHADLTST